MESPILDVLLSEIETDDFDEKVRIISDKIMAEEIGTTSEQLEAYEGPMGPNIFISVRIELESNVQEFITLEREMPTKYIVGHWSKSTDIAPMKRVKVWSCPDVNQPQKIIRFFAQKLKYLKGE